MWSELGGNTKPGPRGLFGGRAAQGSAAAALLLGISCSETAKCRRKWYRSFNTQFLLDSGTWEEEKPSLEPTSPQWRLLLQLGESWSAAVLGEDAQLRVMGAFRAGKEGTEMASHPLDSPWFLYSIRLVRSPLQSSRCQLGRG